MNLSGSVVSMTTGVPLKNVTIWEILSGGRAANVIGVTDNNGNYNVSTDADDSNINFAIDGYTGESIPVSQAATVDQILLAPLGIANSSQAKGIPVWVWVIVGIGVIYLTRKNNR
jgi:hypothetical protein